MTTITDEALEQVRQVMAENERLRKAVEWYFRITGVPIKTAVSAALKEHQE